MKNCMISREAKRGVSIFCEFRNFQGHLYFFFFLDYYIFFIINPQNNKF